MTSVSVDRERFSSALSILEREADENPLSGCDRQFTWLNRAGFGFMIAANLVGFAWAIWGLSHGGGFWYVVCVFVGTTILFMPCHGLTLAIMVRLNWRLVRAVRHQEKTVEKLGLAGALEAPWAGERAKRRVLNLVTLLVGPSLWAWGLGFVVLVAFWPAPDPNPNWVESLLFGAPKHGNSRSTFLLPVFVCFLWTVGLGYMYLWLHRLRRGEERLRVIARLQSSLRSFEKSAEQPQEVQISTKVYDQIARIEQAQISRERADSVQEFAADATPAFVVQVSRAVRAAETALDAEARLKVQDAIESLGASPRGRATSNAEAAGLCQLEVPGTTIAIGYTIDESARRIQVVSMRSSADGEGSTPEKTS